MYTLCLLQACFSMWVFFPCCFRWRIGARKEVFTVEDVGPKVTKKVSFKRSNCKKHYPHVITWVKTSYLPSQLCSWSNDSSELMKKLDAYEFECNKMSLSKCVSCLVLNPFFEKKMSSFFVTWPFSLRRVFVDSNCLLEFASSLFIYEIKSIIWGHS